MVTSTVWWCGAAMICTAPTSSISTGRSCGSISRSGPLAGDSQATRTSFLAARRWLWRCVRTCAFAAQGQGLGQSKSSKNRCCYWELYASVRSTPTHVDASPSPQRPSPAAQQQPQVCWRRLVCPGVCTRALCGWLRATACQLPREFLCRLLGFTGRHQ